MSIYNFSNILGNTHAIEKLQTSIKQNQIPHAFIFTGEKGMGKKLLAATFAKTLVCENRENNPIPCDTCISCQIFESFNHPDIHWIKREKQSLGVEKVREEIISPMEIKPYKSKYKIFIIDEGETLTPQAQNALLKTIEEPPSFGVFLFLASHKENFLPTILSRCVDIPLYPIKREVLIHALIEQFQISQEKASEIALLSGGNFGKAKEFIENDDFFKLRDTLYKEIRLLINTNDLILALQMTDRLKNIIEKEPLDRIFDLCIHFFRDELLLSNKENYAYYTKAIENIWTAKKQIEYNGNRQMVLDHLFLSFLH